MLNGDVKSTKTILTDEPGRSRCARMTFNIDKVASSTLCRHISTDPVDVQPGVAYILPPFSRTISSPKK